jgi:hypothetical protein
MKAEIGELESLTKECWMKINQFIEIDELLFEQEGGIRLVETKPILGTYDAF